MSHRTLADPGIEMSSDPAMLGRVTRLALVSSIALGLIFILAVTTLEISLAIGIALATGWILMPVLLAVSLRRSAVRYLLVVPSALVSLGLLVIVVTGLPDDGAALVGWLLVTGGVLLGGLLGIWFWFRLIPVPAMFDDPFSKSRWTLIGAHITMIVIGLAFIAAAALV